MEDEKQELDALSSNLQKIMEHLRDLQFTYLPREENQLANTF